MKRTDLTRLKIIRAAERMFLERGLEQVSLREISIEADQRNPSAPSYHFGDKRGLVEAILERHSAPIQTGWLATLAHSDGRGRALSLSELVSLLVRPIVAKLDDKDGGRAYLALCAELVTSSTIPLTTTRVANDAGAHQLAGRIAAVAKQLPLPQLTLRMMRVAAILYVSLADYQRLVENGFDVTREAFVDDLIDTLVALLGGAAPRVGGGAKVKRGVKPRAKAPGPKGALAATKATRRTR